MSTVVIHPPVQWMRSMRNLSTASSGRSDSTKYSSYNRPDDVHHEGKHNYPSLLLQGYYYIKNNLSFRRLKKAVRTSLMLTTNNYYDFV